MDNASHNSTAMKLVYKANQIAAFYRTQSEEERVEGVANHINLFWEQRMRRQFFELLQQPDHGFDPLVVEAAKLVRKPGPVPA
ncbi:MAG: formate dehydrogenase subunit delta [Phyllobacterium sp.]